MPLTAILGWLGLEVLGNSFRALQAPFILLSALLPLVSYTVAWDLTGKQKHAVLAGLLTIFPGTYAHSFVVPDSFAVFALAGSVSLWALGRGLNERQPLWYGLAGLAAGFGHLSRADGVLLAGVGLAAAVALVLPPFRTSRRTQQPRQTWLASAALLALGYLLVMGPWYLRNWLVAGTPFGGSGVATMFLTDYDDTFAFGRPLTLEAYLGWGWGEIVRSKAQALWVNLQRLWVENLLIVLLPFAALGLWGLRQKRLLWPFFLYLPLLFGFMTFVFTFPGMRGGLFHSGGALLPFLFAAAGPGLEVALRWAGRRFKRWHARRAWPVFSTGLVGMAILLMGFSMWQAGVLGGEWNERDWGYVKIDEWLTAHGASQAVVMVGDAPAFVWHTGRSAIAIPNEPVEIILAVAERYGVRYLVLDGTRTRTTDDLYAGDSTHPKLVLRHSVDSDEETWQLYEVMESPEP
jgi:4-amino-4-deoxy-L-arabinose transferase-like glycosyltransferase